MSFIKIKKLCSGDLIFETGKDLTKLVSELMVEAERAFISCIMDPRRAIDRNVTVITD